MPENIKEKNVNNKKRLGRGLGSLLSTHAQDFEPENKPKASVSLKKNNDTEKVGSQVSQKNVASQKASQAIQKKGVLPSQSGQLPSQSGQFQEKALQNVKTEVSNGVGDKEKNNQGKEETKVDSKPLENKVEEKSDLGRVWSLGIEKIVPNASQPRKEFDKEQLQELANSISQQGILQPITVRRHGKAFEIIAGERRWRASQLAGLQEVPVIIKKVADQKVMELALVENIQRENLNPVEEAMAYRNLMEKYELTQNELASKVGKDRATVANCLRVLTLTTEARDALRDKKISLGHAKVLLSVNEPKSQQILLRRIIGKKLSVRDLEREVKGLSNKSNDLSDDVQEDRVVETLKDELQKALGTKIKINYKRGKGSIQLSFYSDEQFHNIISKLKERNVGQ